MNLTTVNSTFPHNNTKEIKRENIINQMTEYLNSEIDLIIFDGREESGKTTALSQFAAHNCDSTFSLFIKGSSKWSHDPEMLSRELCRQMNLYLFEVDLPDDKIASHSLISYYYSLLLQKVATKNKYIIFIIDGLEEIFDSNESDHAAILEILPFGFRKFKFILSGKADHYLQVLKVMNDRYEVIPPSFFTPRETAEILEGLVENEFDAKEIYKLTKGIPGNVGSIARLLKAGKTWKEISEGDSDLHEAQWKGLNPKDKIAEGIVGILAHTASFHSIEHISGILKISIVEVEDSILRIPFLIMTENKQNVDFVSQAFRTFAAVKLQNIKLHILESAIKYVLEDRSAHQYLTELPGLYSAANQTKELCDFITATNLQAMLKISKSWSPIRKSIALGLSASAESKHGGNIVRFGIQKGVIDDVALWKLSMSKVQALLAIGNYSQALNLAHSAPAKEEKYQLLINIARQMKVSKNNVDRTVAEEIEILTNDIDFSLLREKAVDIAENLAFIDLRLAQEVLERICAASGDPNQYDTSLTQLAILASVRNRFETNATDSSSAYLSKIKNQGLARIAQSIRVIFSKLSAEEVWTEFETMASIKERLFALCNWVSINRKKENSLYVSEKTLELITASVEIVPQCKQFSQLAAPLPYTGEEDRVKVFIRSLDGHKELLRKSGPSEEFVRLQLIIAQAEYSRDYEGCEDRFFALYVFSSDLEDISTRCACQSQLMNFLSVQDESGKIEAHLQISKSLANEIHSNLDQLLSETADHFAVTKNIIKTTCETNMKAAIGISQKLNTRFRRNRAYLEIVDFIVSNEITDEMVNYISELTSTISDAIVKDDAIRSLSRCVHDHFDEISNELAINYLEKCISLALSQSLQCLLLARLINLRRRQGFDRDDPKIIPFCKALNDKWSNIDAQWEKLDTGYQIVELLAKDDIELAGEFFKSVDSCDSGECIDGSSFIGTTIRSLQLAIRSYAGLIGKSGDLKDDRARIARCIETIPSMKDQVHLWSELALSCRRRGHAEDAKEILSLRIRPLLEALRSSNRKSYYRCLMDAGPLMYLEGISSLLNEIENVCLPFKDLIIRIVLEYICFKTCPSEAAVDEGEAQTKLEFNEMLDMVVLLRCFSDDYFFYHYIRLICETLKNKNNKVKYSDVNRTDIKRKMMEVIDEKLPMTESISHEGYRILCEANIQNLEKVADSVWKSLFDRAQIIPNLSDRSFVCSIMGEMIPDKQKEAKRMFFEESEKLCRSLSNVVDRVSRLETLATNMFYWNGKEAKNRFREAFEASFQCSEEYEEVMQDERRQIIDRAYKIDEKYAETLVELCDQDAARSESRRKLGERLLYHKTKTDLLKARQKKGSDGMKVAENHLPGASRKALVLLVTGVTPAVPLKKLMEYLIMATKLPLEKAFPIYSWILENAGRVVGDSSEETLLLNNSLNSCLEIADFALMLGTAKARVIENPEWRIDDKSSIIINVGEREKALEFIENWLKVLMPSRVVLIDPYFEPNQLEIVRLIIENCDEVQVVVVANRSFAGRVCGDKAIEEVMRLEWKRLTQDWNSSELEFIFIYNDSNSGSPLHDRKIWTEKGGLKIGTSFNSLGISVDSEISYMSEAEMAHAREECVVFTEKRVKVYRGNRIKYFTFDV